MIKKIILFVLLACGFSQALYAQKVSFTGSDQIQLSAQWIAPAKGKKAAIILLHGVGSVKEEWNAFADLLAKQGIGVLTLDLRGHGESIKKKNGESLLYTSFYSRGANSEWSKMVQDAQAAAQFLIQTYKIAAPSIAIGGASIGANIALRYAVEHKETPFAVLLSPGMDYQGLTTTDVIAQYGKRPLFMAVSPGDGYSYQSVMALQSAGQSAGQSPNFTIHLETQTQGHGVQMFKRSSPTQASALESKLAKWIAGQFQK